METRTRWDVLRTPGLSRLAISTVLTRIPVSLMPLALLLFLAERTGSYVAGGLAAAAHVIGYSISKNGANRFAAHHSSRPMLVICSLAYPSLAAAAIVLGRLHNGPASARWLVIVVAFGMGAVVPLVGQVFTRAWTRMSRELPKAGRLAQPLLVDTGYIIGPFLVGAVLLNNPAGYAVALGALCALVGGLLLAVHAIRSEFAPEPAPSPPSVITQVPPVTAGSPTLVVLLALTVVVLFAFGALNTAVVGFAREADTSPAAGWLLGMWAVGGFLGGIAYGMTGSRRSPGVRQGLLLFALAAAAMPMIFADRVAVLALLLTVAGGLAAANTATTMSLINAAAERIDSSDITAKVTALGYAGFAAGMAGGGVVVEYLGVTWAFAICAGILSGAFVLGVAGPHYAPTLLARTRQPAAMYARRA